MLGLLEFDELLQVGLVETLRFVLLPAAALLVAGLVVAGLSVLLETTDFVELRVHDALLLDLGVGEKRLSLRIEAELLGQAERRDVDHLARDRLQAVDDFGRRQAFEHELGPLLGLHLRLHVLEASDRDLDAFRIAEVYVHHSTTGLQSCNLLAIHRNVGGVSAAHVVEFHGVHDLDLQVRQFM